MTTHRSIPRVLDGYWTLGLPILLALIHGLVFAFVMPPWQHYDEPNHFEYVWLLAHHAGIPEPNDVNPSMRRVVLNSMVEHGFFDGMGGHPNLRAESPSIGRYSQLDEPPLYYLVASMPLFVFQLDNVTEQLYAARLVSLILYLLTILSAWGVSVELTPRGHPLRLLVPLSMALLPAFTDLMTAVNNDVGAIAFFSLFLWASVRLICRGFSWKDLSWTLGAVLLCILTKRTVYVALPLSMIALLIALFRGGSKRLVWGFMLAGIGIAIISIFSWGDTADWYRATSQSLPTLARNTQAQLGDKVLRVSTFPKITPPWLVALYQPLDRNDTQEIVGKRVTFGAWIWADQSLKVRTPVLNFDDMRVYDWVDITDHPTFYAFTTTIPEDVFRIWITISPLQDTGKINTTVYFDGIILVEGERPTGEAPQFDHVDGVKGTWGGIPFENHLDNPSFEKSWFQIRPWFDSLMARIMPDQIRFSSIFASLLDISGTGWFYRLTGIRLMRTFWAKFGWGHVPIMGHKPYRMLGFVTIFGLMGAFLGLWRKRHTVPWKSILYMGLALVILWGITLVRGSIYLAVSRLYLPVARYAYPAIIPTMLVLSFGWWQILFLSQKWRKITTRHLIIVYVTGFLTLDILSILSIINFYQH
ncbi:MAG: DUF2142 domain-containing protein [Anaerolineales bacterium]